MRQEVACWLHTLAAAGKRASSWALPEWGRVAAAVAADTGVSSFTGLSAEEWVAAARPPLPRPAPWATFAQLPAQPTGHHRPAARGADAGPARRASRGGGAWYGIRITTSDPGPRARAPGRGQRLNFARVSPAWLRKAIQWYFAAGLSTALLSWSSLPGFLTYLRRHFVAFLAAEGIDALALAVGSDAGIRLSVGTAAGGLVAPAARMLGLPARAVHHRADPHHGDRLFRLHGRQAHRSRRELAEPRWAGLWDAHARWRRPGEIAGSGSHRGLRSVNAEE